MFPQITIQTMCVLQYVLDTTHPEAQVDRTELLRDIDATCRSLDFHRLTVLDRNLKPPEGLPDDRHILSYKFDFKVTSLPRANL